MAKSLFVCRNFVSVICKLKPKNLKKPRFLPALGGLCASAYSDVTEILKGIDGRG